MRMATETGAAMLDSSVEAPPAHVMGFDARLLATDRL
jgi:hypothetical protein